MCRHFRRPQVVENEGNRKSQFSVSVVWEVQDGLIQTFLREQAWVTYAGQKKDLLPTRSNVTASTPNRSRSLGQVYPCTWRTCLNLEYLNDRFFLLLVETGLVDYPRRIDGACGYEDRDDRDKKGSRNS